MKLQKIDEHEGKKLIVDDYMLDKVFAKVKEITDTENFGNTKMSRK